MDSDKLLSDLAAGEPGIGGKFHAYLRPLKDLSNNKFNPAEAASQIKKFHPFLTQALEILPNKLIPFVKAKELKATEWFTVYKLCVSLWELIHRLAKTPFVGFDKREKLVECLVFWSRWEEGESEALTLFKKLKPEDCNNVYLPNSDPGAKYKIKLAKTVGHLCKCVANYKPKKPEPYVRLHQIVTEFQAWIGILDKKYSQHGLKVLITQLLTITSNFVSEFDQFDIAMKMCDIIITLPVQGAHHLTKLCDSLHQIGGHMFNSNDLKQASDVFKLHCEVTWAIIKARLKDSGTDDRLVFFGKWCEGLQSLFQVLTVCEVCTHHQVQDLIKNWTEKWTAEEFCTALPGPISLVEQWVKVEIVKHDENGDDAGTLLGNVFLSLNKAARKKILQQELLFYVQRQNENCDFCERMQSMISNLLKEDGFDKPIHWLEESSSLSLCGIIGTKYSIEYLSQAIKVSKDHQLAMAYALRSLCTDEYEPNSERVIQDIRSALSNWLSIITSDCSMEPGNMINILYSILDLLSLKGRVDLHCDVYKVMIDIYKRRGVSLNILLARLWESRRISHALCPSPIQEPLLTLQEHFGEELKSSHFWEQHCIASRSLLVGVDSSNFSPSKSTVNEVEEMASKLISSGSTYSASCIYYDLSEKMVSNGQSIEALRYAMGAYQLRVELFKQKFVWSSKGCGGEYIETGKHMLVDRVTASELWSFDTNPCDLDTCYVSPWKALQCYLESLLQLGIIHEILGDADKAEAFLDRGKMLSCSHSLTLFKIVFSSCLGELYHKKQRWASAVKELESAMEFLNDIKADGFCSKCRSILEVTVANNLGDLHQNQKCNSESPSLGTLSITDLYKEALTKLHTSEWKMSLTCFEDQDVNAALKDGEGTVECGFSNNVCQNESTWDSDMLNCVVSLGPDGCICETKGCWRCVTEKFSRSGLVTDAIKLKWELVHRRLSHKLLTGLGKYLENDGQVHEACEIICQSISVIVGPSPFCRASKSTFLPDTMGKEISAQRNHLNLYHLLAKEIAGDVLCVERALVLYNLCWLSLKKRNKDTRNNHHVLTDIPISKLVSWLMLAFVLSREVPAVLKKVLRLLAAIFSLSTTSVLEASLSTSCQDLGGRHWACFFHQASLGVQFNYQFPIKVIHQHANTEVSHMASALQKLPRLAPNSVLGIGNFVREFFEGLPSSTIICLNILGYPYTSMFQELVSCSSAPAFIMLSRLDHTPAPPIHVVLPVRQIPGDGVKYFGEDIDQQWYCPWGTTVIDVIAPKFRLLMEELFHLSRPRPSSSSSLMPTQRRVDSDLCQLLQNMESSCFVNAFKYVLLDELLNSKAVDTICEDIAREFKDVDISTLKIFMLGMVKYGYKVETDRDRAILNFFFKKGCFFIDVHEEDCVDILHEISSKVSKALKKIKRSSISERFKSIIFVLDFDVQMVPWESLPILRNQEIYRMPSVYSMLVGHSFERKFNPVYSYYLLNPDGTLVDNANFEKLFKDKKLEGKIRCTPPVEEIKAALEKRDLFIYIGHGSGSKYIPNYQIETLRDCAGAVLCGCGSASLTLDGDYVPRGAPLSYLLADSPFISGYLWPVVGVEAHEFTYSLLLSWFKDRSYLSESDRRMMIRTSMNQARNRCSVFPYMVGASHVCYGVPTEFRAT